MAAPSIVVSIRLQNPQSSIDDICRALDDFTNTIQLDQALITIADAAVEGTDAVANAVRAFLRMVGARVRLSARELFAFSRKIQKRWSGSLFIEFEEHPSVLGTLETLQKEIMANRPRFTLHFEGQNEPAPDVDRTLIEYLNTPLEVHVTSFAKDSVMKLKTSAIRLMAIKTAQVEAVEKGSFRPMPPARNSFEYPKDNYLLAVIVTAGEKECLDSDDWQLRTSDQYGGKNTSFRRDWNLVLVNLSGITVSVTVRGTVHTTTTLEPNCAGGFKVRNIGLSVDPSYVRGEAS